MPTPGLPDFLTDEQITALEASAGGGSDAEEQALLERAMQPSQRSEHMGGVPGAALEALKTVPHTLLGAGKLGIGALRALPKPPTFDPEATDAGLGSIEDRLAAGMRATEPHGVGGAFGEAAQFFALPQARAAGFLKTALAEGAKTGLLASAQEGELEPTAGVAPGVIAGSLSKIARLYPMLKDTAARRLERAVSPRGKNLARQVADAAPHALEQMPTGSIAGKTPEALADTFQSEFDAVQRLRSGRIDEEEANGALISLLPAYQKLAELRDRALTAGRSVEPAVQRQLTELEDLFMRYSTPHRPPQTSVPIRVADTRRLELEQPLWKTGSAPATAETAGAQKVARIEANLIRRQIGQDFPDIGALGQEAHKFGSLKQAASEEALRSRTRRPQFAGEVLAIRNLPAAAASAVGGGALGFAAGGPGGAAAGAAVAPFIVMRVINDPRWLTASAEARQQLARAIGTRDYDTAGRLASRIVAGWQAGKDERVPLEMQP